MTHPFGDVVTVDTLGSVLALALRDSCRCSACYTAATNQRTIATHSLAPAAIVPAAVDASSASSVAVTWADGHHSEWDAAEFARLAGNAVPAARPPDAAPDACAPLLASKAQPLAETIAAGLVDVSLDDGLDAVAAAVPRLMATHGVALVHGVEPTPAATEALLAHVCVLRSTHYGAFWDFTADLAFGDLAYTNVALPAHTDGTYFSDPPRAQIFHCLAHDGDGGDSILVDGFAAVHALRTANPDAYALLRDTPVRWSYFDANNTYSAVAPVITELPDAPYLRLRINNEDRHDFPPGPPADVAAFYAAWSSLLRLVNDASAPWSVAFKLLPGTVCFFDNWRILHGRTAFSGSRRLCGAYYSHQDLNSRLLHSLPPSQPSA